MEKEFFLKSLKDKTVAFLGLGVSNLPLVHFFAKYGVKILACDKHEKDFFSDQFIEELKTEGAALRLGENYLKDLNADIVFRTPGMPFFSNELNKIKKSGVVITSEMEVFFDLCPCKILAVTGSDGKTTTTTIISEMLKAAGKTVHLGGNIGKPLLSIVNKIKPQDIAVVELSSFQLISMRKSPDVAVITNIEANHLDVHKDMDEYINAKKNIILHQNAFSKAVLNFDNKLTRKLSELVRGQKLFFSRKERCKNGAFLDGNDIYFSKNKEILKIMSVKDIHLKGKHNLENYLAAVSSLYEIVNIEAMQKVAKEFEGVEHRSEFIRKINGVKYYNDSIASSPTRTIKGTLSIFPDKIILIAGGYDKKIPFDKLGEVIPQKVKVLILMGQTAENIKSAVKCSSEYSKNNPRIIKVKDMEKALSVAKSVAKSGDIVSLSPASASFDLYKDFVQRGEHFKKIVKNL
ncbi:MAG: UDP-N-acetylmuramoyl-L-alanine--D-glutamate ligase [Oscillospiraceae bacterium]|jgi:UDP-N-acetylmuramoylalanine--D-glutamate ligase|nr:UDP-N-acetylmuramoyl-L-alanine--D-glutamate ligase [Oscillospiraceae bacterium]